MRPIISPVGAWDVPHTNLVLTLQKEVDSQWNQQNNRFEKIDYYSLSASIKKTNASMSYPVFSCRGREVFNAFEEMLYKIKQTVPMVFNILDTLKTLNADDVPLIVTPGWQDFPPKDDDFESKCFSSLSRTMLLKNKKNKDIHVSICKKNYSGYIWHFGCVDIDGDIVFKAKPDFERKVAFSNIASAYTATLGMLNNLHKKSWSTMAYWGSPDYSVEHDYGQKGSSLIKNDDE